MEFVIAWALFAFASYSFAKSKNRNPILWAVIGLLIGPFAMLAIALMKPGAGPDVDYD